MSIAALRKMEALGLSLADAIEVLEAIETAPPRSSGAERQARYRARKAGVTSDVTGDVTSDGHCDVTVQPEIGTPFSQEIIPPSPPKGGSSPAGGPLPEKPKRGRVAKPRFAPDDFAPSPAHIAKVEQRGLSPGDFDRALSRFRNHEFRHPPTDWSRAFHKWLDGEKPSNDRPDKLQSKLDNLDRGFRAAERASEFVAANRTF